MTVPVKLLSTPARSTNEEQGRGHEIRGHNIVLIVGITAAIATILAAFIGSASSALLLPLVEDWRAPRLQFRTTEIILLDGRVAGASINNSGTNPAKEVTIVLDSIMPDFKFTEAHHVHILPPIAFDKELKGSRLEIRLKAPLGSGQSVAVMLDELYYKPTTIPIFNVWVASDRGQATSQGQDVRSVPLSTKDFAAQILNH